jgi:hypothetical protein
MSDFRRFLDTGLGVVRNMSSQSAPYEPFKACELAQYLRLSAAESFEELDALSEKGWLTYAGDAEGLETWRLTRSGWYAQKKDYGAPRFKKSMIPVLEKAFDVVGERFGHEEGLQQIVAYGPWMTGETHGAAVIGLAFDDWAALKKSRRLDLIEGVLACVRSPVAPIKIVVMGFNAGNGIPSRLRTHRVLTGRPSTPHTIKKGLDLEEDLYAAQLRRDVVEYEMHPPSREDTYGGSIWWDMRDVGHFIGTRHALFSGADSGTLVEAPARPARDPHRHAKSMLGEEYFCVSHLPALARKPKRSIERSEPPDDPRREGATWWSLLQKRHSYGQLDYFAVKGLPSLADELCEKGLLDRATKLNPTAAALAVDLDGGERSAVRLLYAAAEQHRNEIALIATAKTEKTSPPPQPVQYFVGFIVGLKRPLPFAIVRQPARHSAYLREAYRLVVNALVDSKLVHVRDAAYDICAVATRFRSASDGEIAIFDRYSKAAGKQVRYIVQLGKADATVVTGRFETVIVKNDVGIGAMLPGTLPAYIDDEESRTLEKIQKAREHIDKDFYDELMHWCFDPKKLKISTACQMLSEPRSESDRRFTAAFDRERAWQFERNHDNTFTARISCAPMMVTLSELGDSGPPKMRLQIGEWSSEHRLVPREGSYSDPFSGTLHDLRQLFEVLGATSKVGLRKMCEDNMDCIEVRAKSWDAQDIRHLAAGFVDAVLKNWFVGDPWGFQWEALFVQEFVPASDCWPP